MSSLTPKQIEARRHGLGASDAITVSRGNLKDWQALRAEKVDGVQPKFSADSRYLMSLGVAIEPLTMRRFALDHALLPIPAEHMVYWKTDPFFFFTPDGVTDEGVPVQAKFHTGDKSILELADFYQPQLQHEMLCMGSHSCWLVVTFGHYGRYMAQQVGRDEAFLDAYLARAMEFRQFMQTGVVPESMSDQIEGPKVPRKRDHIWMEGDNEVKPLAVGVLDNYLGAQIFDDSLAKLKQMMPKDAATATWMRADGSGIRLKANRANAISWTPIYPG